jgi:hypothetical protein
LYSASVLEHDIVDYFLELHEMRLGPRKTTKSPVERRSFGHPAQSVFKEPPRTMENDFTCLIPCRTVTMTYLSILLTLSQCTVVGL